MVFGLWLLACNQISPCTISRQCIVNLFFVHKLKHKKMTLKCTGEKCYSARTGRRPVVVSDLFEGLFYTYCKVYEYSEISQIGQLKDYVRYCAFSPPKFKFFFSEIKFKIRWKIVKITLNINV